jgi:hypothetical protein
MNFRSERPESVQGNTTTAIPRSLSRRALVTSVLNRMLWGGLLSATAHRDFAGTESKSLHGLARYDTGPDIVTAIVKRERIAQHLRKSNAPSGASGLFRSRVVPRNSLRIAWRSNKLSPTGCTSTELSPGPRQLLEVLQLVGVRFRLLPIRP